MDSIILAIMLYLSYIVSPGEYYQSEIDTIYQTNEAEIHAVQDDAAQMNTVETDHLHRTEYILIIEEAYLPW